MNPCVFIWVIISCVENCELIMLYKYCTPKIIELKFVLLQHTLFHRFSPLKFSFGSKHRKVSQWEKEKKIVLTKNRGKSVSSKKEIVWRTTENKSQ